MDRSCSKTNVRQTGETMTAAVGSVTGASATQRTGETVYLVFLSSTAIELAEWRTHVRRALGMISNVKVVAMEDFTAGSPAPIDTCIDQVRRCDIYVGLIGVLFGSSPDNGSKSFTEVEYDTAVSAKMPVILYVAPDSFSIPHHLAEDPAAKKLQAAFRARLRKTHTTGHADAWRTMETLGTAVLASVTAEIAKLQQRATPEPLTAGSAELSRGSGAKARGWAQWWHRLAACKTGGVRRTVFFGSITTALVATLGAGYFAAVGLSHYFTKHETQTKPLPVIVPPLEPISPGTIAGALNSEQENNKSISGILETVAKYCPAAQFSLTITEMSLRRLGSDAYEREAGEVVAKLSLVYIVEDGLNRISVTDCVARIRWAINQYCQCDVDKGLRFADLAKKRLALLPTK